MNRFWHENLEKVSRILGKPPSLTSVFCDIHVSHSQSKGIITESCHVIHELPSVKVVQSGPTAPLLEIDSFRNQRLRIPDAKIHFQSSGTSDEFRAISPFSAKGLELYKLTSKLAFYEVISRFSSKPLQLRGLSLIPPLSKWPNSNLAFMVHSLGKHFPITYCNWENLNDFIKPIEPIWVFGTMAHFVDLMENSTPIALPPDSFLLETGGPKKSSDFPSKGLFYEQLTDFFSLPSSNYIIGEYGMSELASQAYDWEEPDTLAKPLEERGYRFPYWVRTYCYKGLGQVTSQGLGALIIEDRARIDIPVAIKTDDLIYLEGCRFNLQGRITAAPVKGCSNRVEAKSTPEGQLGIIPSENKILNISISRPSQKLEHARETLDELLRSSAGWNSLLREFRSKKIATWARDELAGSLHHMGLSLNYPSQSHRNLLNWLIILPNNHSLVGFHPVVVGLALGKRLTLRLPDKFRRSLFGKWVSVLCNLYPEQLTIVDGTFRTESIDLEKWDGMILYGSDQTVSELAAKSRIPVQTFGTYIRGVFLDYRRALDELAVLIKLCYELGQKGCFSIRQIGLLSPASLQSAQELSRGLTALSAPILREYQLAVPEQLALDKAYWRGLSYGWHMPERTSHYEGLFPILPETGKNKVSDLPPFVTPISLVHCPADKPERFIHRGVHWENLDSAMSSLSVKWNGRHQGQWLYQPSFAREAK